MQVAAQSYRQKESDYKITIQAWIHQDKPTNNHSPQQIKLAQKALPPNHALLQIIAGNTYNSHKQNLGDSTNINTNNHTPQQTKPTQKTLPLNYTPL